MQIASVISSIQISQAGRQAAPTKDIVTAQKTAETVSLETADQATQIMKNYDLNNISHSEVVEMTGKLHDAGVITFFQMAMLNAPPIESFLKLVDGKTVIDNSDEKEVFSKKIDFLKNMELGLASAEKEGDVSSINVMRDLVNLLHNLDALRAQT
ncbi:MAG: hypothetical protein HYZ65_01485 [Burkholderiales bacterium]|nr:hypothetical protein [Burkholderiales bacterium]